MSGGLLEFLSQYTSITPEDFGELLNLVENCSFEKKARLTDIGMVEQHLYFITSGVVRKYFFRGKHEVIILLAKEGNIINSAASFFTGQPSRYILETIEPVTALKLSREKLETLYGSGKKWEKNGRMMTTYYFLAQEQRLLDNIRYSTKERFVRFMNENPDLLLRVPQKHLAAFLNIKPETFSRLKHLMKG